MKILHITKEIGRDEDNAELLHAFLPCEGMTSYLGYEKMAQGKMFPNSIAIFKENYEAAAPGEDLCSEQIKILLQEVDLVHLHTNDDRILVNILPWIHKFHKRLIWSMEDCRAYTAGCRREAVFCSKWQAGCKECPLEAEPEGRQAREKIYAAKEKWYKDLSIYAIASTRLQAEQLRQSNLKPLQTYQLPRLIDEKYFYAGSKKAARNILQFPAESLVICYQHSTEANAQGLGQAFLSFKDYILPVYLVHIGSDIRFSSMNENVRNFQSMDNAARGMYLRAADLYIDLNEDLVQKHVWEAFACGCTAVLRENPVNAEVIDAQTGFLLPAGQPAGQGLWEVLLRLVKNLPLASELGSNAYQRFVGKNSFPVIAGGVKRLYASLQSADVQAVDAKGVRSQLLESSRQRLQRAKAGELQGIFAEEWKKAGNPGRTEQKMFADGFCTLCLQQDHWRQDIIYIWEVVKIWLANRQNEDMMIFSSTEEKNGCRQFMELLRNCLTSYFAQVSLQAFWQLDQTFCGTIVLLWQRLFLNEKSLLNIEAPADRVPPAFSEFPVLAGYPYVYLRSMYVPYSDGAEQWNTEQILRDKMPPSLRMLLIFWLTALPFYGATAKHRAAVLHYMQSFSEGIVKYPDALDKNRCNLTLCEFMGVLWRVSYLGGNNIKTLRAYGDFLQYYTSRYLPGFSKRPEPRKRAPGEKIRIGYVSLRFKNQAVSQYMANRIFCHDKEKFFVKTFMLYHDKDGMTEKIKNASDEYMDFPAVKGDEAIGVFAQAIKESDLDLLIYADIGMDNITYQLGAMHLAPVQAVLVGHGTTTGLSTIDYYISGDHEPENAQEHYVEKLLRLPKLGCVQLPPQKTERIFTRAEFGVPDDAVMFISCANGLKHIPERDYIFIDILKKAPNAYIVLKPFQNTVSVDQKFILRLKKAAAKAKVEDRLIFASPLQHPGDLMGLLVLADVQLDTYPYGGWTTNLEALYYNLPVVTQEGELARCRWGAGLLRVLGITEGIASDEAAYVDWAVRFAREPQLRQKVSAAIREKAKTELFDGQAGQSVYEKILINMVEHR